MKLVFILMTKNFTPFHKPYHIISTKHFLLFIRNFILAMIHDRFVFKIITLITLHLIFCGYILVLLMLTPR